MALHGIHALCDARHHRGCISGAGPDFQHTIAGPYPGRLDHACHHIRLRDRLSRRDRQGGILVGLVSQLGRNEVFARHLAHGGQYVGRAHAPTGNLQGEHRFPSLGKVLHGICPVTKAPGRCGNFCTRGGRTGIGVSAPRQRSVTIVSTRSKQAHGRADWAKLAATRTLTPLAVASRRAAAHATRRCL